MGNESVKKTRPLKNRLKWNAITAVVLVLIGYIGAHVLSRTEGFRQAVADKISNGTRQQISLEKCGMTPLLGLHLEGLSFQGVLMPDVRLSFNFFFWATSNPLVKQLKINELEINLRRVPQSGHWEPLVLNGVGRRLGDALGLESGVMDDSLPTFPPKAISTKTLLQLNRAKIVWNDETGAELAYITDADLKLKSGAFIKRKVIQSIVKCGHIRMASGYILRDFRFEAFRIEGSSVVTVLDLTDSNGEYPEFASDDLWEKLNTYLVQLTGE